jgi:chitodextrinase
VSWSSSTDNVGVTGYRVFRNGTAVATPTATSYADSGLAPGTTYTYRVSARDAAGNESGQSVAVSATTTTPDTTAPLLTNITAVDVTSAGARITWTTNESATSRVDYGTTSAYGSAASISGFRTAHSVALTDLQPSTTYHYRAVSADASGNQGGSADLTFTTQAPPGGPDLIAHWRLDEGTGSDAADAAGGYSGTLIGAAWATGHSGMGVSLDGADDYIDLPAIDVSGAALTIAAWVRSSSFSPSVDQRFITKSTDTAEQSHHWMVGHRIACASD